MRTIRACHTLVTPITLTTTTFFEAFDALPLMPQSQTYQLACNPLRLCWPHRRRNCLLLFFFYMLCLAKRALLSAMLLVMLYTYCCNIGVYFCICCCWRTLSLQHIALLPHHHMLHIQYSFAAISIVACCPLHPLVALLQASKKTEKCLLLLRDDLWASAVGDDSY